MVQSEVDKSFESIIGGTKSQKTSTYTESVDVKFNVDFKTLIAYIDKLFKEKNEMYCPSGDNLETLRAGAEYCGIPVSLYIGGRVIEKLMRLKNIVTNDKKPPKTESLLDTSLDNAVYSLLTTLALLEESDDEKSKEIAADNILMYIYE